MLGISRLGDVCSGHGGFPSRPIISASSNVFSNGIGISRVGDVLAVHCDGDSCHSGIIVGGHPSVFVNGQNMAITSGAISCGSVCMQSSLDCFGI